VTPTPTEPPFGVPDDEGLDPIFGDHDALGGWIDPADRLWRHPSEVARSTSVPGPGTVSVLHQHRSKAMVLVGASAILATVAGMIILLSPSSDRPVVTGGESALSDAPLTTLAANAGAVPQAAAEASESVVQLRADTTHGVVSVAGVAVAEGGLVATTASDMTQLRALDMVGPGGRLLRASVVGIDRDSDVALVDVPDDVPVPAFADDTALNGGSTDVTLSMVRQGGATMVMRSTPGTVASVGNAITAGMAQGMPDIISSAPVSGAESGDPLLNATGAVIGILYYAGSTPVYLPAELVLGVADDLRSAGRVSHGWLGVEGQAGPTGQGAMVSTIMAGSPAAGALHAGERITALGNAPVRSMAELRARLYVLPPNTRVVLSVVSGGVTKVVDVTLSPSP
jgi:trypsin-like peptidase/PDZ domain-containing protein